MADVERISYAELDEITGTDSIDIPSEPSTPSASIPENLYVPVESERTIQIKSELSAVESARLGSQVRSAIVKSISKIADAYEKILNSYVTVAENYGLFNNTVNSAKSAIKKFNVIKTSVTFVDKNGDAIASNNQLAQQGSVTYSSSGEGDNAESLFTFRLPFGQGPAGEPGRNGTNGVSVYVKFSKDEIKPINTNGVMLDAPTAKTCWVGFCGSSKSTVPDNPHDYNWVYIKGDTGPAGPGYTDAVTMIAGQFRMRRVWAIADKDLNENGATFMPCSKVDKEKVKNSELAMVVFRRATGTDSQLYKYNGKNLSNTKYYNLIPSTISPSFGMTPLNYEISTVFVKKGDYADVAFNTFAGGTAVNRYVRWFKDDETLTLGTGTHRTRSDGSTDGKDVFDKAFYFANARAGKKSDITGDKNIYTTNKKQATEISTNDKAETENRTVNQSAVPIAIYVLENVIDDDNIT